MCEIRLWGPRSNDLKQHALAKLEKQEQLLLPAARCHKEGERACLLLLRCHGLVHAIRRGCNGLNAYLPVLLRRCCRRCSRPGSAAASNRLPGNRTLTCMHSKATATSLPHPHKAYTQHTAKAMPSVYELKKTLSLKAGEVLGKGFVVKDIEVRFAGKGGGRERRFFALMSAFQQGGKAEGLTG